MGLWVPRTHLQGSRGWGQIRGAGRQAGASDSGGRRVPLPLGGTPSSEQGPQGTTVIRVALWGTCYSQGPGWDISQPCRNRMLGPRPLPSLRLGLRHQRLRVWSCVSQLGSGGRRGLDSGAESYSRLCHEAMLPLPPPLLESFIPLFFYSLPHQHPCSSNAGHQA